MTATDFARAWGAGLRPVAFAPPKPLLPAGSIAFLHYAGFPRAFRMGGAQIVDIGFLPAPINLRDVWSAEIADWAMPAGWARFWRIGTLTYTQAAAWLCIEELTGRIVGIDIGATDCVYPISASAERMLRCMKHLIDWSRATDGRLAEMPRLRAALAQDPNLAGDAAPFWLPLLEEALEAEGERLSIEVE